MSTSASSARTPAAVPLLTWRDALTPLSRGSRRRWTACYVLLLAVVAGHGLTRDSIQAHDLLHAFPPAILVAGLLVLFGMLRRGTRRITAIDHPQLDERDVAARNSAYRLAFPLLVLVVVASLMLLAIVIPDTDFIDRSRPRGARTLDGWFLDAQALIALGTWIGLWAVFLPTGILAWREPDAPEPENAGGGLPEWLRDGILGLGLAGGIGLALADHADAGFWAFLATLPVLGALARRASGQPAMSRQRKWRVAIGLALIALLAVVALLS